jgi:NAD(P)H dehydrogenase (quinone)
MARVLVLYYSLSGRTELMAERVSTALRDEALEVTCKRVEDADVDELLGVDGVVIGSPTYYGTMAAEVKSFLDRSIKHHGKLDGKVGAAFASAGSTGHETTLLSIVQALLIHGMIVQGQWQGMHYGLTFVGNEQGPDDQSVRRFAQRFAALVKRVRPSAR